MPKFDFEVKMKELELTLESEVLDPAFVEKAKDFKEKLQKKQLTDEEIEATDKELCEMLDQLEIIEEDTPEMKEAQLQKEIAEAKAEVLEAETAEQLNQLAGKFLHLTDIQKLIEKKLKGIQDKEEKAKHDAFVAESLETVKSASSDQLPELSEKYKEHPEITKVINDRIKAEKQAKEKPDLKETKLRETLLTKKEWSYAELKELGITPTGNDMKVAGLRLEKEMYFNIYSVRK